MTGTLPRALAALCLLALMAPTVAAQHARLEARLEASLAARDAQALGFAVRFEAMRVEGGTATLELGYEGGAARVGLGVAANRAFGPLGNVIVEGWGALRTDAAAEGRLGARGVVGPVAVRVTAVAFGARPAAFRSGVVASAERPVLAGAALGFQVGLTARLDRNLILEFDPELYLAGGAHWRGEARLRLLKLFGDNEFDLVARGYAGPGGASRDAAVGIGVTLPRGRAPDWSFAALVGWSPAGPALGARASLAEDLGPARVGVDAAFEPYRHDVAALRVAASASVPAAGYLGGGRWEAGLQVATDAGDTSAAVRGTELALTLALRLPME